MLNNMPLSTACFLEKYFEKVVKARNGEIMIGGLVTTLDTSIGYEMKLETLTIMLGNTMLDLEVCLTMKLIYIKDE